MTPTRALRAFKSEKLAFPRKDHYALAVRNHLQEAARLGWGGAKANLLPALALWVIGLSLVLTYYNVEPVARAMDHVGRWKLAWTPWFAIISTALFGSLIPTLVQRTLSPSAPQQSRRHVLWLMIFWAIQGWEVDILYRTQAAVFGDGTDAATIIKKTLVDQFIWAPTFAVPQTILGYLFIEKNGSLAGCRAALRQKSFIQRAVPLMITMWVVWIPAVSLVYLFPSALQLPLMNIILALWCLILAFFSQNAD